VGGPGSNRSAHDFGLASPRHYASAIFIVKGALRMEFGPGGEESVEAGPGDFVYVPKGAVHREANPTDQPAEIVVVRAGTGDPVTNVDGPEPTNPATMP
jgi:uncharacterized RmlC-like cupin family protein